MQNKESTIEILNDLIRINNDRIAGYERAINEANDLDVDLKATFERMVKDSIGYKQELSEYIRKHGGAVESGTTTSGKIYRAWMDVKANFTGSDRKTILASCEFGEDAAQRAYKSALEATAGELEAGTREMVEKQQQMLKSAHDLIKRYRDAHEAVPNK